MATNNKNKGRLRSLDVARGMAIIGMVVVNSVGTLALQVPGATSYTSLLHAEWDGCTVADLVFPLFLFFVGFANAQGKRGNIEPLILGRRMFILVVLGLGVNSLGLLSTESTGVLRFNGVLQRIGFVSVVTALLYQWTSMRMRAVISLAVLAAYAAALEWVSVPGIGMPDLNTAGANLIVWFDALVLGDRHPSEPEAFLTLLSSATLAVIGTVAGDWVQQERSNPGQMLRGLGVSGAVAIVMGVAWGEYHPMVKQLWTSSYMLYSAGVAALLSAVLYYVVDFRNGLGTLSTALEAFGRNSIGAYVLHVFVIAVVVGLGGKFYSAMIPPLSSEQASLPFVAVVLSGLSVPIGYMYRRRWFVTV